MNNKISCGKLLDEKGNLIEAGYQTSLVKEYNRSDIKARKSRIKEWDYYYVGDEKRGVAFTIDDNSYMGLGSVSLLNFESKSYITKSHMKWFTNGKIGLPSSSVSGTTVWKDNNYSLEFKVDGNRRILDIEVINYHQNKPFKSHIELTQDFDESMVIVTPFDKPKHFYYNQKINCLKAKGYYEFGGEHYDFNESNSRGVLDWGRGVWTYKNTWYWSSLNSTDGIHEIGFNLGYGFGDTSKATENMLFYDNKAYKLNDVVFNIPIDEKGKYDYLKEWTFTSSDNSINLTFTPLIDRKDLTNVLVIKSLQHQVFGKFNGTIKIDNIAVEIKDLLGFAERVTNWW